MISIHKHSDLILNPFRIQFKLYMILHTHTQTQGAVKKHVVCVCVYEGPAQVPFATPVCSLSRSLYSTLSDLFPHTAQNTPATIYPTPEFPMQKQVKTCSANSSHSCLRHRRRTLSPSVFATKTTCVSFASKPARRDQTKPYGKYVICAAVAGPATILSMIVSH